MSQNRFILGLLAVSLYLTSVFGGGLLHGSHQHFAGQQGVELALTADCADPAGSVSSDRAHCLTCRLLTDLFQFSLPCEKLDLEIASPSVHALAVFSLLSHDHEGQSLGRAPPVSLA